MFIIEFYTKILVNTCRQQSIYFNLKSLAKTLSHLSYQKSDKITTDFLTEFLRETPYLKNEPYVILFSNSQKKVQKTNSNSYLK